MIDTCFLVAYVAFGLAVLCAALAVRHAVRCDLRAVLDDLSGKRRAQGLEEFACARLAQANARRAIAVGLRDGASPIEASSLATGKDFGTGEAQGQTELGAETPATQGSMRTVCGWDDDPSGQRGAV